MAYEKLLSPMKIGGVEIKNRTVMTAMGCSLASLNGTPSDEIIAYYVERAEGGVGLIINEVTRIDDETGVTEIRQLCLTKDENVPAFRKLTDAVHEAGARIFCQLHHPGRQTYTAFTGIDAVVSASDQPCGLCQQPTRALTTEEVHAMVKKYIQGAVRAKAAGYDGIELHAAHGYLIEQFLSPYTNHRTDEYGGSMENRMRMLTEIIDGIHGECGRDYPISVRITVDECLEECGIPAKGLKTDETIEMCKILEKKGIDVLNVSVGMYETVNTVVEPNSFDEGWRSHLVKAVKEKVSIPVMGNAVIRHPQFAEKLLEEGCQDFISMGRTFLADPAWVKKVEEGRVCEIRKCISCLYCFETVLGALATGDPLKCALNPRTGHEARYGCPKKDGEGRTVAVIGAGPAGMEAAKVLAVRGFKPVILEAKDRVGGQLNIADKPPKKERITELIESMVCEIQALGVEIRLNTPAAKEAVKELNPYAVIIATGGAPVVPGTVEGISSANVCTNEALLSGRVDYTGKHIAVIGARNNGLETAEYLADRGNQVTVIEMLPEIGSGIYFQILLDITGRLGKLGVEFMTGRQLMAVRDKSVTVKNVDTGEQEEIEVDAVVLSVGTRPVDVLSEELKKDFDRVIAIGDAGKSGRIGDATRSAYEAACSL